MMATPRRIPDGDFPMGPFPNGQTVVAAEGLLTSVTEDACLRGAAIFVGGTRWPTKREVTKLRATRPD